MPRTERRDYIEKNVNTSVIWPVNLHMQCLTTVVTLLSEYTIYTYNQDS